LQLAQLLRSTDLHQKTTFPKGSLVQQLVEVEEPHQEGLEDLEEGAHPEVMEVFQADLEVVALRAS